MDHTYIEANNIIARYEMGKLSVAESAGFEEHFVDCPQCQKQLATATDFREALQLAARQGAWHQEQRTPAAWPTASVIRWAIAACLAVAVGLFLLVRRMQTIEGEAAKANANADAWQHKYESAREANNALESQLQQSQAQSGSAGDKLPILASVFTLNRVRSVDPEDSVPVNWVVVSRQPQWIVLSLARDPEEKYKSYRVTLAASSGRILWTTTQPALTPTTALSVSVPSKLVPSGDYTLTVEGMDSGGAFNVSGRYPFRVKYSP